MTNGPPDEHIDRAAYLQARREEIRRRRARERAAARRRGIAVLTLVVVLVVSLLVVLLGGGGGRTGGLIPSTHAYGGVTSTSTGMPELSDEVPALVVRTTPAPALPFPSGGQGAVAVVGSGVLDETANEQPVPIASVTKMMTAYLTLRAHPLTGDESGPVEHFTAADHANWLTYAENDLSNVELVAGEQLTERQLLEALLLPSADNVADWLARWVGGTEQHFVAMMNETAHRLGMDHTHYADASGVDPKTVSTAGDQALLASIDMRNPVFRSIVALQDVPFPVEGSIWNVNPALGVDGIVGIKSGFTQAASGCLATAAWRTVGDRKVLVIAVVLGQRLGLWQAADADEALIQAVGPRLEIGAPLGTRTVIGKLSVPWSHASLQASITAPLRLVGLPGLHVSSRLVGARVSRANLAHGWPAGARVGELRLRSQYGPLMSLPVTIGRPIAAPPVGDRPAKAVVSLRVVRR